jgi:hypothetical protein
MSQDKNHDSIDQETIDVAIEKIASAIWNDITGRSGFDIDIDHDIVAEIKTTWGDIVLHHITEHCYADASIIVGLERAWDDVSQDSNFAEACLLVSALEDLEESIDKVVSEVPTR